MIIVIAEARFRPGTIDSYRNAMATMIAATRAEDGCISYAYAVDRLEPDLLRVTEIWRDQAAVDAHFQTAHMAAFNQVIGAAKPLSLTINAYDAKGPRALSL